ncbi:MAG: AAA family ATPase [Leptospirales bacterium]|jgi:DNA sulfur modification protein DndD
MKSKKSSRKKNAPELFETKPHADPRTTTPARPAEARTPVGLVSGLALTDFGKFKNRRFEMGATTVFFGPNEAGKTTIFDGLFAALCRPRANRTDGKRLRERYGEDARAAFEPENAAKDLPTVTEEEFMNLYAVRAGDIRVEINSRSSWMDRVKSRLFSGDLDPAAVARNLAVLTSDDGKRVHNKELKKLYADLARYEQQLEEKNAEQQRLRLREKEIEQVNDRLETTRAEIQNARQRLEEYEAEARHEERIRERDVWHRRLKLLKDFEQAGRRVQELALYAADELPALEALEAQLRGLHETVLSCSGRVEYQARELDQARGALEDLEAREPLSRRKRSEADHCLDRLQRTATNRYVKTVTSWNAGRLLAAGGAGLLGGCGGFFGASALVPGAESLIAAIPGGLLGALLLGGPLLWFARSIEQIPDDSARRGLLAGIKDDWRSRLSEEFPPVESLEAAGEALTRFRLEAEALQKQIDAQNERVRALKNALHESQSEREAAVDRERAKQLEIDGWLKERNVEDRAAYVLKRDELRRRREDRSRLESDIAAVIEQGAAADREGLQIECERRLKALDEDGVPAAGKTETEFRNLQNQISRERMQLDQLSRAERELGEKRAGDSGELRGALQRLTAELGGLEQSTLRLRADIAARELDKDAAGAALKIFEDLRSDNNVLLEQLLGELGHSVRKILPGVASMSLQQDGDFALQELLIPDAGGTERPIEHLSSGTRDSFVFAARIALAGHSREENDPAMLILDEPFLTLDEPRERQCLEFLREFQQERGWQLVLLTKEERLRDLAREIFGASAVLHELNRIGDEA